MKNTRIILLILILCVIALSPQAQEYDQTEPTTSPNHGFYVGGLASTNGFGFNLGYVISPKITIKGGWENLSFTKSFDFDESDISYTADLDYKTGSIFLVADYFFVRHFYVSGGAGINNFNPEVEGRASDAVEYGDITIPPSKVGTFFFSVEPSLKVSPYLSLGYRKFFGKQERVSLNVEAGFYYQGAPKLEIEATGLLAPTADPAHGKVEYLEDQFDAYTIYPVLKMNLAVKLFNW